MQLALRPCRGPALAHRAREVRVTAEHGMERFLPEQAARGVPSCRRNSQCARLASLARTALPARACRCANPATPAETRSWKSTAGTEAPRVKRARPSSKRHSYICETTLPPRCPNAAPTRCLPYSLSRQQSRRVDRYARDRAGTMPVGFRKLIAVGRCAPTHSRVSLVRRPRENGDAEGLDETLERPCMDGVSF